MHRLIDLKWPTGVVITLTTTNPALERLLVLVLLTIGVASHVGCKKSKTQIEVGDYFGNDDDDGFGAALVFGGDSLFIGAPHGAVGRVYRTAQAGVEMVFESDGRGGSALGYFDDGLLVGVPFNPDTLGSVVIADGGAIPATKPGTGGAIAAHNKGWAITNNQGWQDNSGFHSTPYRPVSISLSGDMTGVGMPSGDYCILVKEESEAGKEHLVERPISGDLCGYSLVSGDFHGDGKTTWFAGAPGSNSVHAFSFKNGVLEHTQEITKASLGFGHALAMYDIDEDGTDDLIVGAPFNGDETEGSIYIYTNGNWENSAQVITGTRSREMFGFSVAATTRFIAVGSPSINKVSVLKWER